MRLIIACACCFVATALAVTAQSLSFFDVDTSQFPVVSGRFYAFDARGQLVRPAAPDIALTEQGEPRSVQSLVCPQPQSVPVSSVLVMDVSSSMSLPVSSMNERADLIKGAAYAWTQGMINAESECALTAFNDTGYVVQTWTTNRAVIRYLASELKPRGGTDYDRGLLLPPGGGLQVANDGNYRRVVVFMTDGLSVREPQTAAIIAQAQRQNCAVYVVTLWMRCPQSLKAISERTGGRWFEDVMTRDQVEGIYRRIAAEVQGVAPCEISWRSPGACRGGERRASLTWRTLTADASFTVPARATTRLTMTPPSMFFRSKPVGGAYDTTITVTAGDAPVSITGITSSDAQFDISPKSFVLGVGESRSLTVRYRPTDSAYTWTTFDLQSDECSQQYYASGGYFGVRPKERTLRLDSPSGFAKLAVGADVPIRWSGIPLSDSVTLLYSLDTGKIWRIITEEATGGEYLWRVPKVGGKTCLLQVRQHATFDGQATPTWIRTVLRDFNVTDIRGITVGPLGDIHVTGSFFYEADFGSVRLRAVKGEDLFLGSYNAEGDVEWMKGCGGAYDDGGYAVAVDGSGDLYMVGTAVDSMRFDETTLLCGRTENGYWRESSVLARYRRNGEQVWARCLNGTARDIVADRVGNLYVLGIFYDSVTIDGVRLTAPGSRRSDIFLAKFRSDGSVAWVRRAGGTGDDMGSAVALDSSGNVYITGWGGDMTGFEGGSIPTSPITGMFLAKYRPDGEVVWAVRGGGGYASDLQIGAEGDLYTTGSFYQMTDFGGIPLSTGNSDINNADMFLAKYRADGNVVWAKRVGGGQSDRGQAICVDDVGDLYVTGEYGDRANFDGTILRTSIVDRHNIFAAKYGPDGKLDWVRHPVPGTMYPMEGGARGVGIVKDRRGAVYLAGQIGGIMNFEHGVTVGASMMLWNMGTEILQRDTSDRAFELIGTVYGGDDVEFGKVTVGGVKDTAIVEFFNNPSSQRGTVRQIRIIGSQAEQFSLVSPIVPFDVAAKSFYPVEFRFRPTSAGLKSAQLRIITQSDTITSTIRGEGVGSPRVDPYRDPRSGEYHDAIDSPMDRLRGLLGLDFLPTLPPMLEPTDVRDAASTAATDSAGGARSFGKEAGGLIVATPGGRGSMLSVRPNPVRDRLEIEFEPVEPGRTRLYLVDAAGRRALTILDEDAAPARRSLTVDVGSLASGHYRLVLETPTERWSLAVELER